MPWVLPLVDVTRTFTPAVFLLAQRAVFPGLFEAHTSIALLLALFGVATAMALVRPGHSKTVFHTWSQKMLMICAGLVLLGFTAAYFVVPWLANSSAGALHGRTGAFLSAALSGRMGLILFSVFTSTGLLFFSTSLWVAIREPVDASPLFSNQ